MSELLDSEGGFLVPLQLGEQVLMKAFDGEILSRVTRTPAESNKVLLPLVDESSRADGSRYGGARSYWVNEGVAITASQPAFGGLAMRLGKVGVVVYASDELIEDGLSFGYTLERIVAAELQFKIEDAIISGSGLGQPLGVLKAPALITCSKETGQGADTFTIGNSATMYSRMWVGSRRRAVWLVAGSLDNELAQMAHGVGASSALTSEGGQRYLHARPVIPIEYAATLGDAGDILFCDLGEYQLADRGGPNMARSIHLKFLEGESAFRFSVRVAGQPSWKSAVTPYKETDTQSPFITLEARA
jgi:HK97 family phage major capsid protein